MKTFPQWDILRDYIFQLPLAQWQSGCWAVGMAAGCSAFAVLCPELALLWGAPLLPLCPVAVNQATQLSSTAGLNEQHGDARRPGNTGGHSGFAPVMRAFLGADPKRLLHLPRLCWPTNNPPVKCSTRLQASLWTGSVHFIPSSPWLPSLADGDWGLKQSWRLKQRCYMWILPPSSLCCTSILPIKPFLLPSPARNTRSHGKDNQT